MESKMTEVEAIENDEVENATGFVLSDSDDFGDHEDDQEETEQDDDGLTEIDSETE